METIIHCKKCGHTQFARTDKPAMPAPENNTEYREFACTNCGELMYYECPVNYVPTYDPNTGMTAYHDTIEEVLSTDPDEFYDMDAQDFVEVPDERDDDGGFDPDIG